MKAGLLALCLLSVAAQALAVSEPSRDSVADSAVAQIDEPTYLGVQLDGATRFIDSLGRSFTLNDLRGQPLILLISYYHCDGACPTMNRNLAAVLHEIKQRRVGRNYRVLTVSFDARDDAAAAATFAKETASALTADEQAGWRFAVLAAHDAAAIKAFTQAVGFNYFWSEAARAFIHPNVLIFLTPQGRVARYIYGTRMNAQNLELALIDADWERISNSTALFDQLTGACFSYNYVSGRYEWNVSLLTGVAAFILGLGLLAASLLVYRRRLKRTT